MVGDHSKDALLWGRRRECEVLDSVVEDAIVGRSRALVLRGEAGIGKSALLDYLHARASTCRIERAFGVESEMELPYAGLHQLCKPMVDRFDHLPDEQRAALATIFGFEAGPPPGQYVAGLSVLGLLADVSEDRPLVCIVDDAQWLDSATAKALAFAARRLFAESVALVFAVREPTAEPTLTGLPDLLIEGLGNDDSRALVDSGTAGLLDEGVRDQIVAESRGNPLALLELPRALTTAELELGIGQHESVTVATRIEHEYARQLQTLPADTQRLLLLAAIEPVGDLALLWNAAHQLGIGAAAAAPAEAMGLATFGSTVRFRHPLVRSAIRRTTSMRALREAHRALADATDADADPDRRAWHRAHAAAAPDEAVASELEVAADRAQRRGGWAAAAAFLQRATELSPEPARRGTRAVAATRAKLYAAEVDAAMELAAVADLCPLTDHERVELERMRAIPWAATPRDLQQVPMMLLHAGQRLAALDALAARSAYLGAFGMTIYGARGGGDEDARTISAAVRDGPPGPDPPRSIDRLLDGLTTLVIDGHRAGFPLLRRALVACEEEHESEYDEWSLLWLGAPLPLWFVSAIAPEVWDDVAWDRLTTRLLDFARGAGVLHSRPNALNTRARFQVHAGNLTGAAALIDEAETINDATGTPRLLTASLELVAWRGREATAIPLIESSVEFWSSHGVFRVIGRGAYAKSVLYNGVGRYDDAFANAQQACEYEDMGLFGLSLVELVEAASRSDQRSVATASVEQLEVRTRAAGTDWALGMLARSRALLSDGDDAEALYREAIERLDRSRMAPHGARARLLYGEWLRRANRRIDAREQLRSAYEAFVQIGTEAFAERARRELAATGETARKRTVETNVVLTPQEAHIARLAGERRTNPEIAAHLFISPRTVEYHLAKVFTKLDIGSRRELAGALQKIDLSSVEF